MTAPEQERQGRRAKCQRAATYYQGMFAKRVPPLSSLELLRLQQQQQQESTECSGNESTKPSRNLIVVDVRTRAERRVSMIAGARSLHEFYNENDWALLQQQQINDNNKKSVDIVFYCTIGYRSGMQARHFMNRYCRGSRLNNNSNNSSSIRVYNLDGCVAYAQAFIDQQKEEQKDENQQQKLPDASMIGLVEPSTGQPAGKVHTFGRLWNFVDNYQRDENHDSYYVEATYFSFPTLLVRLVQVGGLVVGRSVQHALYVLRHEAWWSCRRSWNE